METVKIVVWHWIKMIAIRDGALLCWPWSAAESAILPINRVKSRDEYDEQCRFELTEAGKFCTATLLTFRGQNANRQRNMTEHLCSAYLL